jgi:predicted nuclease of predicted toxin-antitoxin system
LKFICDEGVDRPIVEAVRDAGHDVTYVAEQTPGIDDEVVLRVASEGARVLVTAAKDFGALVFRQGRVHGGIILVRLHGLDAMEKGRMTVAAIAEHGAELEQSFAVLKKGRIRIRKRPS